MSDLFANLEEAERQRLRAAGWTLASYYGQEAWVSPDKRLCLSREEALRWLDRQEGKKGE